MNEMEKIVMASLMGALEKAVDAGLPNVVEHQAKSALELAHKLDAGQPLMVCEGTETALTASAVLTYQGRVEHCSLLAGRHANARAEATVARV